MQNKINRLEARVKELEEEVAKLKGFNLLTDFQQELIADYFSEYAIDKVRVENGKIVVDFQDDWGYLLDYKLDEIKATIDEDMRLYLHDLIDCKHFDFDEVARATNDYRNFLEKW